MSDQAPQENPDGLAYIDEQCARNWPDAINGEYDPRCCRFPKSCSVRHETHPENTASLRTLANNHQHGVRRTPHPNETVEAYTARMTVDENARKREAFAKFIAARGTP